MRLGRESEYGLNGLVTLAREGDGAVMTLDAIANRRGLPRSFLAKIFVKFVQHGLVKSFRGAVRGYALARSPGEITLREILETIEGPDLFERCLFRNRSCADPESCPLHEGWMSIKSGFMELVERTTLETVAGANRLRRPLGGDEG